jgi:hypothetical protein
MTFVRMISVSVALFLAACAPAAPASSPAAAVSSPAPSLAAPGLAADRQHFAADTIFVGSCSEGHGCYELQLHADGTAVHVLQDARVFGSYRLDGKALILTSKTPEPTVSTLATTDDFRTLEGGYRFTPGSR